MNFNILTFLKFNAFNVEAKRSLRDKEIYEAFTFGRIRTSCRTKAPGRDTRWECERTCCVQDGRGLRGKGSLEK